MKVGITLLFTVITMDADVAGEPVAQERLLVMVQVMASPVFREEVVNVAFVSPETGEPFLFH